MDLGNRLYELRKKKNLSQEEVAEKLGVTRQTISKWETNQSQPDFDKILPLCILYEISTDELLTGNKKELKNNEKDSKENKTLTALVVSISVFLYFLAIIWIIVMEPLQFINDNLLIGIFLLICAIATVLLTFHFINISKDKKVETEEEKKENQKYDNLTALIFTCIYLLVSFFTKAWHISWLLWIVYAIVIEIIHLILEMKGHKNEKQ